MASERANATPPYFRNGAAPIRTAPVRIQARMEAVRKDAVFRAGSGVRKEIRRFAFASCQNIAIHRDGGRRDSEMDKACGEIGKYDSFGFWD